MSSNVVISEDRLEFIRFLNHPREAVFEAWTNPELLSQWWGCKDTERVEAESDPRQGGSFRYVMHMKGGFQVPTVGEYVEFVPPKRLVTRSEMGAGTPYAFHATVTVEFIEEAGGTRVKVTQVGLPPMPEPGPIIAGGLNDSFEKLERFLGG